MLAWTGIGAGLMYFLDPEMGNRRRALVRDKFVRAMNLTGEAIGTTARDARNRAYGTVASLRSMLSGGAAGDEVVAERVRSKLGFLVRHPSSIEVTVKDGHVTLSGPILTDEVDRLIRNVEQIRGGMGVENRLEVHEEPGNIPGLQGQPPRRPTGQRFELLQENWSPTARVLVGVAGGTMAFYGASRRNPSGTALALAGTALLARAVSNMPLKRLVGIEAGRRAIDINKTITINAPLDQVFRFIADYQHFPNFMRSVEKVEDKGHGILRWTLVLPGPEGFRFHWNSVITRFIPDQEIAWRTEPDSMIQHAGIIKFAQGPDGATTLHIRMSYNPPGGALGHALAAAVGMDAKSLLDEELMRLKSVIETGKLPEDVKERRAG